MTTETKTESAQAKPADAMDIIALLLGELRDMRTELNSIKANGGGTVAVSTGRKRQPARPVRDTKTGKVYHAESAAGMAVAGEYGFPAQILSKKTGQMVRNSFVWYNIPDRETRFEHISMEEYQAILKTTPAITDAKTVVVQPVTPPANTHQPTTPSQKPVQQNQAKK